MTGKDIIMHEAIKSIAGRILRKPETATENELRAMSKYLLGIPVLKEDIPLEHLPLPTQ